MTSHAAIGVPTEVLVAPDSFKGTFSARAVAEALAPGLAASGQPVDLCPVADGGEGTLSALAPALGLEQITVRVERPARAVRSKLPSASVAKRRGGRRDGGRQRPGAGRRSGP